MLQQSKAQEQRAIKASYCALKAVKGAQQLIEQVFGVEGIETFLSIIQLFKTRQTLAVQIYSLSGFFCN